MYSCFDALAAVLEAESWVMLTTVERDGSLLTRPAKSLRIPFRGHIWLEATELSAPRELDRVTEATVTFGDSTQGRYVTVSGWAMVLDDHDPAHRALSRKLPSREPVVARSPVMRVTARAAQLWDHSECGNARIFAFPPFHESDVEADAGIRGSIARDRAAAWRPALEQSV